MSANGSTVSKNNANGFLRAVRENNIAEVGRYIQAGVDINRFRDQETPLYIAIQNNNAPMVKFLLEANAAVNILIETDSLLYFAVSQGNVQIVELLLRAGADPEFENMDNQTPLFKAVEIQSVKIIQLLCEYNANPDHSTFDKTTPLTLAKSERVRKALEACVPERKGYRPTARGIQTTLTNLIASKGVFPIQSQKTGQCFSDSLQHVLYFADGIRDFFIERAVEVYPRIKMAGEIPLTRDEYVSYLTEKIKTRYARFKKAAENNGRTYPIPLEDYLKRDLPREAVNLYLDVTGVRFLDMFLRPIIQAPPSKKSIMARRPSVVSFLSNQPTGIVCSQILNIYQVTQSVFKERMQHSGNANNNNSRNRGDPKVLRESNLPHTLNEEGFGLLTDSTEYEFWREVLGNIPGGSGTALVKGETSSKEYKMAFEARNGSTRYAVNPNFIVGILFAVFPVGHVVRNLGSGHALSMVKTHGQWYLCDDNIGIALPCAAFDMNDLLEGQFTFRYSGFRIQYYIHNEFKFQTLLAQVRRNHPRETNLRKYLPEEMYITILAEVPLKGETKIPKIFEESVPGGEGGFMDMSISRKYICWEPVAAPPPVATVADPNSKLRAIAAKYGLNFNTRAAGSGV